MFQKINKKFNSLQDLSLLLVRMVLAYGFYEPAKTKWTDIHSVGEWLAGMGVPMPVIHAYLSASFEMLGVFLLLTGWMVRWISFPLIIIMIVAIQLVHWKNGFAVAGNGYEIPLYYIIMLMVLMAYGAGKYSLDYLIGRARDRKCKV